MEYSSLLRHTSENVRKLESVEEKLWFLEQCFLYSPILSRGIREIGFQPRRYFGFSIPSVTTMEVLQKYIDTETEVLEIGCGLGLYAFVFGTPIFCKRWQATDHPDRFKEWLPVGNQRPYVPVELTRNPMQSFSASSAPSKRVLLTVWPEANSTYFWDDYVRSFDGDTIIIIGIPGVTGKEEMWDWLSARYKGVGSFTTVCKLNLGCIFDYETIYVWRKLDGEPSVKEEIPFSFELAQGFPFETYPSITSRMETYSRLDCVQYQAKDQVQWHAKGRAKDQDHWLAKGNAKDQGQGREKGRAKDQDQRHAKGRAKDQVQGHAKGRAKEECQGPVKGRAKDQGQGRVKGRAKDQSKVQAKCQA